MKQSIAFLLFCLVSAVLFAQPNQRPVVDKIVAVVGDEIVMQSAIEQQFLQMTAQEEPVDENTPCVILEDMLFQNLLLNQAKLDSLEVSDGQVEGEMDRRMRYFVQQFGSERKLEEFYGKTIIEIKKEFSDLIRDQILVQQMQSKIIESIKVNPSEVKEFYKSIPKDSLPYINAQIELAQIVRKPKISDKEKQEVLDRMKALKKRIDNGENFGVLAYLYSEDPGSAKKNGELGFTSRSMLVPEFAAVAFSLNPGQVSDVVETQFGYHIIQGILRRGEEVNVRHILLRPKVSPYDLEDSKNFLDSLYKAMKADPTIRFEDMAMKYSEDLETKTNGGLIINPMVGNNRFEMDEISQYDPSLFVVVNGLEVGDFSRPVATTDEEGNDAYRIVKLVRMSEPHVANLADDYNRLQAATKAVKEGESISNWINSRVSTTYIKVDDKYKTCKMKYNWFVVN